MNKFYKIIFFSFLLTGSLITLSSYSWMMMWMGLELNILSFIPLIHNNKSIYSTESAMKYFMIQTLASTMLIFALSMLESGLNLTSLNFFNSSLLLLQSAILMKLGMAPFHFWFPEVNEGLMWSTSFLLLTWQKLAPMSMLMMTSMNNIMIITSLIFSSIVGSMMGLNQTSLRKILSYSSINHMSWMTMSMMYSINTWMLYFIIYSVSNLNLIYLFNKMKTFSILQLSSTNMNHMEKLIIFFNLLSLAGLPPLIGFFPKWMTISLMVSNHHYITPTIIIIFSIMAIFFYIQMTFPILFMKNKKMKFKFSKFPLNFSFSLINMIFLFSLTISSLFF